MPVLYGFDGKNVVPRVYVSAAGADRMATGLPDAAVRGPACIPGRALSAPLGQTP